MSGQSLIRAAEVRSVVSDFQRYQAAYYSFRDKYRAIPGDITNATRFWGAADGSSGDGLGADCFTVDSSTLSDPRATCNGSGDGLIATPTSAVAPWTFGERFRAWQHLANAGLIEGNYTGRTDSTSTSWVATIGKNVPAGRIGSSYLGLYGTAQPGAQEFNVPQSGNRIQIVDSGATSTYRSPLTPEEAWNLDTKLDDGKPAYGRIRSLIRSATSGDNCTSSDTPDAEYDVRSTSKCVIWYAVD